MLATTTSACDRSERENAPAGGQTVADEPDVPAEPPGPPPIESLPKEQQLIAWATHPVPWLELGELGVSFYDNRLALHAIQGGPVIDLGAASAGKYIQGRWRAPWLPGESVTDEVALEAGLPWLAGLTIVWNEGAGASLRFPVPDDLPQDVPYRLLVRLRPKSPNRRIQVDLNDKANLATVDLSGAWETLDVPVPVKTIKFGGENTLSFVFGGSYFEDAARVGARFADLRLVPDADVPQWKDVAPPPDPGIEDARIMTLGRRALGLAAPSRYDAYVVLPEHARFRAFIGPASFTQTPTRFRIAIRAEEQEERVLFDEALEPGSPWLPWEVDLAELSGQAVRISFAVEPGPQGPTGTHPAVYLGEPAIVIVRPPEVTGGPSPAEVVPDRVVVIGIDALRADRVAPAGTLSHPATPTLTRLASEGARLEALVQGAGSVVPTASILTGTYGEVHGVFDTLTHVRTSLVTIGEVFDTAGWETGFMSTDPYITLERGFAQGFDRYRNLVEEQGPARTDRLIEAAIRIVKKKSTRPRMLYIQIGGLRLPHQPAPEALAQFHTGGYTGPVTLDTMMNPAVMPALNDADKRYLAALYDAELSEIDALLGKLVTALEETGELDRTLLIVVGMHGEPLGEDPTIGYNNRLSDAELRVPLVVRFPARLPAGLRPAQTVELVDILPTVTELCGLQRPEGVQGASLVKVLDGRRDNAAAAAMAARGDTHRAIALGRYHYILRSGDNDLLFDRALPGGAQDDRSQAAPIARRAARDALATHLAYVDLWDKERYGTPASPKAAFAPMALQRGW